MEIRLAYPEEAEQCWHIRNLAIRHECLSCYNPAVVSAWTPDDMPEVYRDLIIDNPFYICALPGSKLVATGVLELSSRSLGAIFTLPEYTGKGFGSLIIESLKKEAIKRKIPSLTLSSTPNAKSFYEKHGFKLLYAGKYYSLLAQADLGCFEMEINLT